MAEKLDKRDPRNDLTDRECAKLLGATIGGLITMSDVETVRRAIRWWAEDDAAWTYMGQVRQFSSDS
jgi:hypothetical protein